MDLTHRHMVILSANVRCLRTNVGELTHSFIRRHKTDLVVTVETFLDDAVEPTFAKIPEYSHWNQSDQQGMQGEGIAICYRECLLVQELLVQVPQNIKMMFFHIILSR